MIQDPPHPDAGLGFRSDNIAAAHPEVLAALAAVNRGAAAPYGEDPWSQQLHRRLAALFERDPESIVVAPLTTGTAANALALAVLTPPWGGVFHHQDAHIHVHEGGAPEFFTGGAKLLPLDGADGRIGVAALEAALAASPDDFIHSVRPMALSLTQATEVGTVSIRPRKVRALTDCARTRGLRVHLDGARFANAVAAVGYSPAAMSWQADVEALSFGATKNGALAAEALIVFDPTLAQSLRRRAKRGGHLISKMRFVAAQLLAVLEDDLWLVNAPHANRMAARLGAGLAALPGVTLVRPPETNMVLARLPAALAAALRAAGAGFYDWGPAGASEDDGARVVRLMTAWNTDVADVDRLLACAVA